MLANYYFNHSFNLFSNSSKTDPFTVAGTSTIKAEPDQALIFFTVAKTAPELSDAQAQANEATNAMVGALKQTGIAEKDIKTGGYNSYPNYEQNPVYPVEALSIRPLPPVNPTQKIVSYTVSQNIQVNLPDISKAETVIDVLTAQGAENISGPNYSFSEKKQKDLSDKLRLEAITKAKEKAEDIAKAAGIRLGKVINVQESSFPYPMVRSYALDMKAQGGAEPAVPTQLNPGENELSSTVTLFFETW
jgi:uncharacterized protein YggE